MAAMAMMAPHDDDLACIENLLDALQLDTEPQTRGTADALQHAARHNSKGAADAFQHAARLNSKGAVDALQHAARLGSKGCVGFGVKDNAVVSTRELCDVLGLSRAMASMSTKSDVEAWDMIFDRLCEDDLEAAPVPVEGGGRPSKGFNPMDVLLNDLDEVVGADVIDGEGPPCNESQATSAATPDCQARLRLSLSQIQHLRGGLMDSEDTGDINPWEALLFSARGLLMSARSCSTEVLDVAPPPPREGRCVAWGSDGGCSEAGDARTAAAQGGGGALLQVPTKALQFTGVGGPAALGPLPDVVLPAMRDFAARLGELEEEGDIETMQRFLRNFLVGVRRRLFSEARGDGEETEGSNGDDDEARTVDGAEDESDEDDTGPSNWSCRSFEG